MPIVVTTVTCNHELSFEEQDLKDSACICHTILGVVKVIFKLCTC